MRALSYGSYAETLYAMPMPGSPYANSTTRTCVSLNTATTRAAKLPADFFNPHLAGNGQGIRVIARGFYSTTGAPTLQVQVAFDTTQGTFGTVIAGSGTYTTESGQSNLGFELEADVVCTATGTSGTVQAAGTLQHGPSGGSGAGNAATTPGANLMVGAQNAITVNTAVDNYVEVWATWGTASPSNTLTLTQLLLMALN